MDETGRKRGGRRSIESSVSVAEHARLQKARNELFETVAKQGANNQLFEAVKDDILSRAVDARNKTQPDKSFTKEDILTLRSDISPGQVAAATMRLLLQVLLREQHNAQLNGKTKQERTYRPDVATLTDAIQDLTPQAAKKFLKSKSATFLLEHHQQMIQQRIREMAGKEALLKPVEFIAETSDPAYYVGKLFYRGSFNKVSIIEENCVGTETSYFEDSKVNPETGRPNTEIFVVMKRWEQSSEEEREAAVTRLLGDTKTSDAIVAEIGKIIQMEGFTFGARYGSNSPIEDLLAWVADSDHVLVGEKEQRQFELAQGILRDAAAKVLNG